MIGQFVAVIQDDSFAVIKIKLHVLRILRAKQLVIALRILGGSKEMGTGIQQITSQLYRSTQRMGIALTVLGRVIREAIGITHTHDEVIGIVIQHHVVWQTADKFHIPLGQENITQVYQAERMTGHLVIHSLPPITQSSGKNRTGIFRTRLPVVAELRLRSSPMITLKLLAHIGQ